MMCETAATRWPMLRTVWRVVTHNLPLLRWLPRYSVRTSLMADCVAALALATLAAPEAISYAAIAGVAPTNGLYSAFIAPIAYAITGSSPQLVTGPTTVMSILTRGAVPATWNGEAVSEGSESYIRLAALLAFVVGCWQIGFAVVRAGFITRLISGAVIVGFTTGSALLIASTQFSNLLGVSKCVAPSGGSCSFANAVSNIIANRGEIAGAVVAASAVCVAFLLVWKHGLGRVLPGRWSLAAKAGPLALLLVTIPIMYSYTAQLEAHGIKPVETIPAGLPPATSPFPARSSSGDVLSLFAAALPLALIGFVESLTIGRRVGKQYGPYSIDPSQELLAVGVSNVAVALGQGYPVTGSFSRTAVNAASGARSPVASLLGGLSMVFVLLWLAPALSYMPKVAAAAVVISVIWRLIEVSEFLVLWRTDKREAVVALAVFAVTLFTGVTAGLIVGIGLSWTFALTRGYTSRSVIQLASWDGATRTLQALPLASPRVQVGQRMDVAVLTIPFELQFHYAELLRLHVEEACACYTPRQLLIDLRHVWCADASACDQLVSDVKELSATHDCHIAIVHARPGVRQRLIRAIAARGGVHASPTAHSGSPLSERQDMEDTSDGGLTVTLNSLTPSSTCHVLVGELKIFESLEDAHDSFWLRGGSGMESSVNHNREHVLGSASQLTVPVHGVEAVPGIAASDITVERDVRRRQHEPFSPTSAAPIPPHPLHASASSSLSIAVPLLGYYGEDSHRVTGSQRATWYNLPRRTVRYVAQEGMSVWKSAVKTYAVVTETLPYLQATSKVVDEPPPLHTRER